MSRGHHCLSPAHVLFLSCCFQTHLEIDGLSAAGEEGSCIQTQIGAFNHKLMHVAPSSSNKVLVNKNHLLVCILLPDSKGFCHISLLGYSSVYSRVWCPSKLHAYANFPLFWQINFTSFIPRSHSFSIILLGWRGAGLGHLELLEWYCLICYMIKWLFLREHEVYNKIKTRQKMSIDKVKNCLSGRCFRMHWHLNSFTLSLIFCHGISHIGVSYNYMGWELRLCWTCGAQESTAINTRKLHITTFPPEVTF